MQALYKEKAEEKREARLGLTAAEVEESRKKHGANIMTKAKKKSFLARFVGNLGDPVVKILIVALILNLIFTFRHADWLETGGIAVSVFLATLISTLSEHGSEAAFDKLKESVGRQRVRVMRDGEMREIDIDDVVVGDLIYVGAGEQIAADGFLVSGEIGVDQSAMTGESREVYKRAKGDGIDSDHNKMRAMGDDIDSDHNKMRATGDGSDRAIEKSPASPSFCLRGSTVVSGEGRMIVSEVGDRTFLGGISQEIQEQTRESPLKIRLCKLAKQISTLGYIAAALVTFVYLFNVFVVDSAFDIGIIRYKLANISFLFSHLFHALTLGLTVVVMAVPEGLPMMIAVVLSSNIKKMVKDNVLVRKPVGIEAAGSMNILFTDKTGTLTEGKLSVGKIYLGDGYGVDRIGDLAPSSVARNGILLSAIYNTTSSLGRGEDGKMRALGGNSTDRALLSCAAALPHPPRADVIERIPFDSEKKFSLALIGDGDRRRLLIKGAPEKLFPHVNSFIDRDGRERAFSRAECDMLCSSLARKGKRLLAIGEVCAPALNASVRRGDFGEIVLYGIIVLEDKIRKEARASVERLRGAGVRVVMITGDNRDTAAYIAERTGIIGGEVDLVITSDELSRLSDARIKEILPRLAVVARALPNDKSRLVRVSQELDMVVGMTGDGINDAPALKRADVGFSMGSGTEVAKDAGDIIILDDNLKSVVKAVLYGRNIFKSIRKFVSLQLTMNLCACGVSMICPFLGFDSPVTVVQMLWINIIMDTLGGLAFAGEPARPSYMNEKPKRRDEPILNGYMINEIIFNGSFTVGLCIALLKMPAISSRFRYSPDNIYLLTAFFALFIFASVFNCFNARTDRLRLFSSITKNRAFILIMAAILIIQIVFVYLGGQVLRTAPLTAEELVLTSLLALTVFPADAIRKLIFRALFGKRGY